MSAQVYEFKVFNYHNDLLNSMRLYSSDEAAAQEAVYVKSGSYGVSGVDYYTTTTNITDTPSYKRELALFNRSQAYPSVETQLLAMYQARQGDESYIIIVDDEIRAVDLLYPLG